ncbi:MarR family winged helix-turn-helix transcriptional regulator [Anseongella ginsenosidimutans]|nr:winged helix DNA-binding protein [Anseongella ginsenosidimutans]
MKNKTVQLVLEWADFEEAYPEGNMADFCRYYLARQQEDKMPVTGAIPDSIEEEMMRTIGRISKLHLFYANLALKGTDLHQIEEFWLLCTIRQEKNPKKSEVIYANLLELSSGTDMLNRMKQRGLIREVADKEDKRSKRIMLTEKGEEMIDPCFEEINKSAKMLVNELSEMEKGLAVHLLKSMEIKFSSLWTRHRSLPFEEIYRNVMEGD